MLLLPVAVHRAKYLTFRQTNNDDVVPSCVGVCVCVRLPVRWVLIGRAGSHSWVYVCVCVRVCVCVCVHVHVHVSIWRVPISREFVRLGGGEGEGFKRTTACLANISDADITEVCCKGRRGFGRGYARGLRLLHGDALRAVTACGTRLLRRCVPRI